MAMQDEVLSAEPTAAAPGAPGRAPAISVEQQKETLIGKAASLARDRRGDAAGSDCARFLALFYAHVPPADIVARSPADLCGAALSLRRFAERRRPGQAKIRVFNPNPSDDGWCSTRTIVEIVNDDMPFLVDSTTLALNGSGRVVHLAIHPMLNVTRDAAGRLQAVDGPDGAGARESWMQIEISPISDPQDIARIAETLSQVLADVRVSVGDWQNMRRRLQDVLEELATHPPPLPPPEIEEGREFLRWLDDDNFTFLGYRGYVFDDASDGAGDTAAPPLGILRESGYSVFAGLRDLGSLPPDVQEFMRRRELLVVTKSNLRSTVHRTAHMDAIGLRRFGADGRVVGLHLFLGLFTSLAYSRNPRAIPLLRLKVRRTFERAGLAPSSHDGKALLFILETFPRDELFQIDTDTLFDTAIGILNLQERQRITLFLRRDPLERFVSCLVYVPRERYDTTLRQRFAAILEEAFAGQLATFNTLLDEAVLARIQFIIRTTRGAVPPVDPAALEMRLAEAGRSWSDRLEEAAITALGEEEARARLSRLEGFPIPYQARTEPAQALADLARLEAVRAGSPLEVALQPEGPIGSTGPAPGGEPWPPQLRLYRAERPVVLSDVLPVLENLGLRVIAEEPFRIAARDGSAIWIDALHLEPAALRGPVVPAVRARFEAALVAVWTGQVENDGFNRLVLAAGLSARQVTILRLYCKLLRQAGTTFSQAYMEETLAHHPQIAGRLVSLFELRFDPAHAQSPSLAMMAQVQAIDHALDAVDNLDEDRILRQFLLLVLRSLRTNYYQETPAGGPKPYLSVKFASSELDLLPKPRPLYEIFVYSPRVEGVHMRGGKVARGGIRWSDRREDFRTEILGLMKAQMVKNAVIVPVGSKGGFVIKRPPAPTNQLGRDQLGAEAVECYKILMRGLLDLTDNIVGQAPGGQAIEPPPRVVRRDGDDPYLVVAADKGTATFSDIANAISQEYGFWLGDAFASGGSAGYDHKAMGITARGAWELVKRHFRERGHDTQRSPFTVVGVGDMSGDVFGNGMLMSRQIRLLGAFNHLHIFVDPDPDPAASFAERERLFRLPRSGWGDYDRALISPGGGVFERSAKSIGISPQMRRVFGVTADLLPPAELIRMMLTATVDLLWFGGIGTYVKARGESHADAGDRANDALRVDAAALRAGIVGEGANLGVTQRGRVEFALGGGRINTDAIDNSAGVDTSDHEVNIKILLDGAIRSGRLPEAEREPLLAAMAADVARLVLRDNYLQGAALSVAEAGGVAVLDRQLRVMRELERAGRLDRAIEFLPDDETLSARAARRQGLVRPELAVLLAYAKMTLDTDLLASDLPDAPALRDELSGYFPDAVQTRLADSIAAHPLKREIIATVVTNDIVNRAGLTFVHDMRARTGCQPAEAARAYRIVRIAFALAELWQAIEALDGEVRAAVQLDLLGEIGRLIDHAATWLLRRNRLDLDSEPARLGPAVTALAASLGDLLPTAEREVVARRARDLEQDGVPPPLAARCGALSFLAAALDIADLAERTGRPLDRIAAIYYAAGTRFGLDALRDAARRLPAETPWQKLAIDNVIDEFFDLQAGLAARVVETGFAEDPDPLGAWVASRTGTLAAVLALAAELRTTTSPDLAMLVVASRQLRQAVG
jgi:glutamate dehydrogenase